MDDAAEPVTTQFPLVTVQPETVTVPVIFTNAPPLLLGWHPVTLPAFAAVHTRESAAVPSWTSA